MMTAQEKSKVIEAYLDPMDCSSPRHISEYKPDPNGYGYSDLYFEYELGSNEGCFMTIGEYVYRCHCGGPDTIEAYCNAIKLYLTLV